MTGQQFFTLIRGVKSCRLAIGLAVIHLLVFLLVIFSAPLLPAPSTIPCEPVKAGEACFDLWSFWGFYVAGRYFHDSWDFRLLALGDFPMLLVVDFFTGLLSWSAISMSRLAETYFAAAIWLFFGTAQWWLIGAILNATLLRKRNNTPLQPTTEERGG
jgi:hypothetical protein